MNKLIFATVAATLAGLVGSPMNARADHDDDEAVAAIGGFVGGLIVGTAINSNDGPGGAVDVGVVVGSRYGHGHPPRYGHGHGHWNWVTVRVWVPGRWVYDDCHRGRPNRVWIAGHHEHRRERVWVAHRGRHGCDRGCR